MKLYVAIALTALVPASAFADGLATQRAAVQAKLAKGSAPAVPTGIEVPGSTYYVLRSNSSIKPIYCDSPRGYFDYDVRRICGRDSSNSEGRSESNTK